MLGSPTFIPTRRDLNLKPLNTQTLPNQLKPFKPRNKFRGYNLTRGYASSVQLNNTDIIFEQHLPKSELPTLTK